MTEVFSRRPGREPSYASDKFRRERREFFREHGWGLLGAGLLVAAALTLMLLTSRDFTGGLIVGAGVASLGWVMYLVVVLRSYNSFIGAKAERWTTRMLKAAPDTWRCLPNVPFENYDVDHVVLTADAVLAIEVKWRPQLSPKDQELRHEADLRQARKSADRMRAFLRTQRLTHLQVLPVLLLWGPGTPDLTRGKRVDGEVHVLDGTRFDEWKHDYTTGHRLLASTDALFDALTRYVESADDYKHRQRHAEPRSRTVRVRQRTAGTVD